MSSRVYLRWKFRFCFCFYCFFFNFETVPSVWLFFILHTGYVRHHSCLPFRSIRVHTRYLVGFILLNVKFFLYHCFGPFVFSLFVIVLSVCLRFTTSDYPFCDLQTSVSSIKRLGNIRYLDIPLCFLCDVLSYVQNDRYFKKKFITIVACECDCHE